MRGLRAAGGRLWRATTALPQRAASWRLSRRQSAWPSESRAIPFHYMPRFFSLICETGACTQSTCTSPPSGWPRAIATQPGRLQQAIGQLVGRLHHLRRYKSARYHPDPGYIRMRACSPRVGHVWPRFGHTNTAGSTTGTCGACAADTEVSGCSCRGSDCKSPLTARNTTTPSAHSRACRSAALGLCTANSVSTSTHVEHRRPKQ